MRPIRYLHLQHNTWYVRMRVPADVLRVIGKSEFLSSLQTSSVVEANRIAPPIIAGYKAQIDRARAGTGASPSADDLRRSVQMALAAWSLRIVESPAAREAQTPWESVDGAARLERAVNDPDGWRQVPDFESRALAILTEGGVKLARGQVGAFRQEIAMAMLYAERHRERERAINAASIALKTAESAELDTVIPAVAPLVRERSSMTLNTLFERWIAAEPPPDSAKDEGKLHHQIRRLVEFTGDIPANHLTRAQIEAFFRLVAKVPVRRSAAVHAMPIQEVADWVDATNEREEEAAEIEGREPEFVTTLTRKTAMLWFHAYQRMFRYAIRLEFPEITRNPFEGMQVAVKGDASIKRRGYTADEIASIFAKPLFCEETGAKRWLPILALFHGARLSELAAMPAADFRKIGHYWVFDLTDRKLKTERSSRLIPLHPKMERLGWQDYVAGLDGKWLFPDLDHASAYGPRSRFLKVVGHVDGRARNDRSSPHLPLVPPRLEAARKGKRC